MSNFPQQKIEAHMGCDIHLYVERHENGVWKSADKWSKDKYAEKGDFDQTVEYEDQFYTGRNYDLFAILADVRNGRGFAGIDTGEGFVPIVAPKGLPDDMSAELAAYAKLAVDHTPSWLTVAELLAYDWTRITTKRGTVSAVEYHSWMMRRGNGRGPSSYSGDVWGGNVMKIEPEEMERRIAKLVQNRGGGHWDALDDVKSSMQSVYTRVSWQEPYYRAASNFLSDCLPRLWKLGKPEDVRIVFWFDN